MDQKLFVFLFMNQRGGKTRENIVKELFKRPYNANQLSCNLGVQYRTINHHLVILLNNNIVEKEDKKYGALYTISEKMQKNKNFINGLDLLEKSLIY